MKAIEHLERLKRMTELIRYGSTGTPGEFSERLGISRRQLYADIEFFRDLGADIAYSKQRQTFFFASGHDLEIRCTIRVLTDESTRRISGGF